MPKTSKKPKHPRHMTTEEAVSHLFHPKVVEHLKKAKEEETNKPPRKKA
jgi:hypothetical protein